MKNLILFLILTLSMAACQTQKGIPLTDEDRQLLSEKLGFDLNDLDKDGLIGPKDGKTALDFEFCIPRTDAAERIIQRIDPDIKFHNKSKGRIKCKRNELLCIGHTHKPNHKDIILQLVRLKFVKRIERTDWEG